MRPNRNASQGSLFRPLLAFLGGRVRVRGHARGSQRVDHPLLDAARLQREARVRVLLRQVLEVLPRAGKSDRFADGIPILEDDGGASSLVGVNGYEVVGQRVSPLPPSWGRNTKHCL